MSSIAPADKTDVMIYFGYGLAILITITFIKDILNFTIPISGIIIITILIILVITMINRYISIISNREYNQMYESPDKEFKEE